MKDTEAKAKTAIALLRDGLRELDFQRLAKASSELVRSGVLESSHGIELSKTVGFLRCLPRTSKSGNASTRPVDWEVRGPSFVPSGSASASQRR